MSIIDTTWILNRARSFLGQNVTGQIDFKDEDILACLDQETLPTFSIYMPWLYDMTIDTKEDRVDPSREGIYQIKTQERLLGVTKIREGTSKLGGFLYDPLIANDIMDRQLIADRQSAVEVSLTFSFRAPNILEIFPKGLSYSEITFEAKLVHPTHLRTIPPGAREILRELFLCDLAIDVLSVRQYFQNLQTPFGELNLNLDRLSQQAEKRDTIIEKIESKQLVTSQAQRIWVA